jgi:hypothetical protein
LARQCSFDASVWASCAPKDLLDSFVESHRNGGRLGEDLASSAWTTATDNGLVKVSLNLLTEEVLQYAGLTEGVSV